MAVHITSLTLKRFRSVISSELTFDNPTFLIGRNGAGKSNIVDALNFLADCASNPLDVVFDRRGGIESVRNRSGNGPGYPPNLGLKIGFEGEFTEFEGSLSRTTNEPQTKHGAGEYAFEIRATKNGGFEVLRERCFIRLTDGAKHYFDRRTGKPIDTNEEFLRLISNARFARDGYLFLPWLSSSDFFREVHGFLSNIHSYSIDPSQLRKPQDPDPGFLLRSDGSNAGSVLQRLERSSPERIVQICEILAQITPNASQIKPVKHGKQLTLAFQQNWGSNKKLKFEAHSASDGTLRALGILIAIFQSPDASLLIIEEPESSLHPGALDALLQLVQSRVEEAQFLITTHSSDLLDARWIKPENLRLVSWDGGSEVDSVSSRAVRAIKSHMSTAGELMRADALEEPLPGLHASHPEYKLFPEYK